MYHIFYNQIKEGERYEISLGCLPSFFEVGAVVPVFPSNDLLPLPKFFQEPVYVRPRSISLQGHHETSLIQSVILFAMVQKYHEEWVLINASQILSKFKLQDGRPRSPPCTESTEEVLEADTCPQTGFNNFLYHLP